MSDSSVSNPAPCLFGIVNSNRKSCDFWGKNRFNSSFPAALACWMRHEKINPVYVHTDEGMIITSDTKITFDEVFNSTAENSELRFDFESKYTAYEDYVHDHLESIDLVISEKEKGSRALEVKLTVLPDQTTHAKTEEYWGCELVVRPVSVIYAALTIFHSTKDRKNEALAIIQKVALDINDWTNVIEISSNREKILAALELFLDTFCDEQEPLILQPVWKTRGKRPDLAEQAFDIFVWSNMALCRLFINQAKAEGSSSGVSRHLRASARLLRCLSELFTVGKIRRSEISRMSLGNQTDKEFSASGAITNHYMRHERLTTPRVHRSALTKIILNGGEKLLSPERRFDATIFFTAMELFSEESENNPE